MTETNNPSPQAWDTYWRGTHEKAAHQEGGAQDAALKQHWQAFFNSYKSINPELKILDIACGNGALIRHADESFGEPDITALDYSLNALKEVRKWRPNTLCTVADAKQLPFAEGSFDLVVSQFGVEYAGAEAITAAGKMLAPGGTLALLVHLKLGAIYRECNANESAITEVQSINLLPLAQAAFSAGFALNAGKIKPAEFQKAEKKFTPAVRAMEAIMRKWGPDAAGGLLQQLYADIAQMYQTMSRYAPEDVLSWLEGMTGELEAYRWRMKSMQQSALDEGSVQQALQPLIAEGVEIESFEKLKMAQSLQAGAWVVIAKRSGTNV